MKKIELTSGKFALVDDEDFETLNQYNWFASESSKSFYARRNVCGNKKTVKVAMHRQIMGFPDGLEVDHKDGNGLNNQKSNLRICSKTENLKNKRLYKNNKTGFKGVTWHKQHGKYYSSIRINGKYVFLGLFLDPIDAAKAYDREALKNFGKFARLNFGVT